MPTSYATWSLEKLKKESLKIEKAIKLKETKEKKRVVAQLRAVAKKHGFALSDLIAAENKAPGESRNKTKPASESAKPTPGKRKSTKPRKRAKAKIKYRNPQNRQETWTGRGRQPRWVVAYIGNGGSIDQLTV